MVNFVSSEWLMDKSQVSVDGGMVVAKQEYAARAGAQVLADGGNAVDAAVAVAWVMNVMEPYNTSIAGSGYLVYRPAEGDPFVVDFSNRAPMKATQDALKARTTVAFRGPLAAAVPGTVAGLSLALERFGTLSPSRVMAPAIEIADAGMPLDWVLALRLLQELNGLRANLKSAEIFLYDGDPGMAHGQTVIRQPELAATLRQIAEHGPEVFYGGPIGRQIVDFVQGLGGLLELDDMAGYQARIVEPLRGRFRDYGLLTVPPPSPGITTVQCLQMLEGFDLRGLGHNSVDALHVMAETFRLAFADRDAFLGDPDFCDPPVSVLGSPEYAQARRQEIDMMRATDVVRPGRIGSDPAGRAGGGGGTTHISVVDAAGNAVSMTHTLIGGWSGLGVAGNTGVVMNCALQWFDPNPDGPNSVAPGKRPLSNMTPMIVERDGRVALVVGAPGSRRITNAVSQVALNALEYQLPIQAAVSAPRIDCSLDRVVVDSRIDGATVEGLAARGHEVEVVEEFINSGGPNNGYRGFFARPAAVFVDDQGIRWGGDYPYIQGTSVGVPRS